MNKNTGNDKTVEIQNTHEHRLYGRPVHSWPTEPGFSNRVYTLHASAFQLRTYHIFRLALVQVIHAICAFKTIKNIIPIIAFKKYGYLRETACNLLSFLIRFGNLTKTIMHNERKEDFYSYACVTIRHYLSNSRYSIMDIM